MFEQCKGVFVFVNDKRIKRYLDLACNLASCSTERSKHGAVIVCGKDIVGTGVNTSKSSPLQKRLNNVRFDVEQSGTLHTNHAEVTAFLSARHLDIDYSKCSMFIAREMRDGKHTKGLSRPCPSCMKLIKELGIKDIYYTTDAGFAHEKIMGETFLNPIL